MRFLDRIAEQIEKEPESEFRNAEKDDGESDSNSSFSHNPTLERYGYHWGSKSMYWTMWTIWEPSVLHNLQAISELESNEALNGKLINFVNEINDGFSSFLVDSTFQPLERNTFKDLRIAVIRLDFEDGVEPFLPLTETVEIKGSEIIFNTNSVALRRRPIYVVACAGLAEILRAVCKRSDLLILTGTFKRAFDTEGKTFLLLNFDNVNGQVQIIRLTFMNMEENYIIEKIIPTEVEKRFIFKYFVRGATGKPRKQIIRHSDFKWVNNASEEMTVRCSSINIIKMLDDFRGPIQNNEEVSKLYWGILPTKSSCIVSSASYPNMNFSNDTHNKDESEDSNDDASSENDSLSNNEDVERDISVHFSSYASTPILKMTPLLGNWESLEYLNRKEQVRIRKSSKRVTFDLSPVIISENSFQTPSSPILSRVFSYPNIICILNNAMRFLTMAIVALCLLLLFSAILNLNPKCNYKEPSVPLKFNENIEPSVLEKFQNLISFVVKWFEKNCNWKCMMKRFGFTFYNNLPPVV